MFTKLTVGLGKNRTLKRLMFPWEQLITNVRFQVKIGLKTECGEAQRNSYWVLDEELECFLPYLVRHSLYAPVVTKWLLLKCRESESVANSVFWEFQTYLESAKRVKVKLSDARNKSHGDFIEVVQGSPAGTHIVQIIHEALTEWRRAVPETVKQKIENSVQFISMVRDAYNGPGGPQSVADSLRESEDTERAGGGPRCFYMADNISKGRFAVNVRNVRVLGK